MEKKPITSWETLFGDVMKTKIDLMSVTLVDYHLMKAQEKQITRRSYSFKMAATHLGTFNLITDVALTQCPSWDLYNSIGDHVTELWTSNADCLAHYSFSLDYWLTILLLGFALGLCTSADWKADGVARRNSSQPIPPVAHADARKNKKEWTQIEANVASGITAGTAISRISFREGPWCVIMWRVCGTQAPLPLLFKV